MSKQDIKSNSFFFESNSITNGAIVGLLTPISIIIVIKGMYASACLGGTIGVTGGFGSAYFTRHTEESVTWSVFENMKYGGAVGTSLGAILASVPTIVEYPIIIPLSLGTMVVGAALGLVMQNINDIQSEVCIVGNADCIDLAQ